MKLAHAPFPAPGAQLDSAPPQEWCARTPPVIAPPTSCPARPHPSLPRAASGAGEATVPTVPPWQSEAVEGRGTRGTFVFFSPREVGQESSRQKTRLRKLPPSPPRPQQPAPCRRRRVRLGPREPMAARQLVSALP